MVTSSGPDPLKPFRSEWSRQRSSLWLMPARHVRNECDSRVDKETYMLYMIVVILAVIYIYIYTSHVQVHREFQSNTITGFVTIAAIASD